MVFFILISTLLLCRTEQLLQFLAPLFQTAHLYCLSQVPHSEAQEIISSLMCGDKIHSQWLIDFFSRSSMYHLIVAAKAHLTAASLIFVWLFEKFKNFYFLFFTVLVALTYILFCGPQAPLLRAAIYLGLLFVSQRFRLGWSRVFALVLSTLCCLILEPAWYESLALLHSSSCALAFLWANACGFRSSGAFVFSYAVTLPFLWGWANLHPLGIVINVLLAPLLFSMWMCCSAVAFVWSKACPLLSAWIMKSIHVCELFLDAIPSVQRTSHLPSALLWFFFWAGALGLWTKRRYQRQ
jgi:predicted membrane metal-binding protein